MTSAATYATGYEKYRQQGVMTASPSELIVMLYEGCIKQLKLASIHIEQKNIEKTNDALKRAMDIINELVMSLDFHYDMAQDLMDLYSFLLREVVAINAAKDASRIPPVIDILVELKDAWSQVAKQNRMTMVRTEE